MLVRWLKRKYIFWKFKRHINKSLRNLLFRPLTPQEHQKFYDTCVDSLLTICKDKYVESYKIENVTTESERLEGKVNIKVTFPSY